VTSVCNFKTKECTDTADRIVGGDQQQGVVAGAVAVESSPASGGPSAPTGGRAASVDQRVFGAVDNQQP
jgi:hypothetical protein